MEQLLSISIISELIRRECHARELARRLDVNHMTVVRRLRELVTEKVLDFRREGRNKVHFLKDTAEARSYAIMAECHRLNQILLRYPRLRRVVTNIQKDPDVSLAILFGSHAKGTARKDSDIDVYVETGSRGLKKRLSQLSSRLSVKTGAYDRSNLLIREIEKDHVIIKGIEAYHAKAGLFEEDAPWR